MIPDQHWLLFPPGFFTSTANHTPQVVHSGQSNIPTPNVFIIGDDLAPDC